jgi:hypothetical protein
VPADLPDFVETEYGGNFSEFRKEAADALEKAGMVEFLEKALKNTLKVHADGSRRQLKSDPSKTAANMFLNRLLGIRLAVQGQLFAFWQHIMHAKIREAKQKGEYQEGILDIPTANNHVQVASRPGSIARASAPDHCAGF